MEQELINEMIGWDVHNWAKALPFWEKHISVFSKECTCLELGSRRGGLSLWLAMKNNKVICSDVKFPTEATKFHGKYGCQNWIRYEEIDATEIPYENEFDIVVFKSIMGGISRNNKEKLKNKTINEIYKSLKKGGKLLFAENLASSFLHKTARSLFIKWGKSWNYLEYKQIEEVFQHFDKLTYKTVGFFGAFGRSEKQRVILGKVDDVFDRIIPNTQKYIVIGVAEKK